MEAQTGAVTFPSDWTPRPRRRRIRPLSVLREISRAQRERAIRTHDRVRHVPGSEHTHLLSRPRGF
jgi:hypothetical protein